MGGLPLPAQTKIAQRRLFDIINLMLRIKDKEKRLIAFDTLTQLKTKSIPRNKIIKEINTKFSIPIGTLYTWYSENYIPFGRRGKISHKPELFYVLGALLGDGCAYNWKTTNNYTILVGDYNFANKYAKMATECINTKTKAYIDRNKNIWLVRSNNFELYSLFKKSRENLDYLEKLINKNDKKSALLFIEGFFDAEGCVKIIKETTRKTPKICLDITNTNYEALELIKKLLKKYLDINSEYSVQKAKIGNDGFQRKEIYHLRIYKKESIRTFLKNISTTKLNNKKIPYVQKWLNNGR